MKKIDVEGLKQKAEKFKTAIEIKSPEELRKATECSVRGFQDVLFGEKAFRTDLVVFSLCALVAGVLRFYGLITSCECAVMVYVVFMALVGEIINTAIETTVNRISTDYHELSRRAKDIGSAIVFVSFFGAAVVWLVILLGAAIEQGWFRLAYEYLREINGG